MPPEALGTVPIADLSPAATRARLNELDGEIAAIETSLVRRTLERQPFADHLAAYIYPVLTLPNEIISEIFLQHVTPHDLFSSVSSPLFLGHICKRWREIALSSPSLWTGIFPCLTEITAHQRQLHLLELWLTRSRSCPLFIYFLSDTFASQGDVSIAEFIKAILPHCGRWERVELIAPLADLRLIHGDMPMLRFLGVSATDHVPDPSLRPPPIHAFRRAANLETVVMVDLYNPIEFHLPWGRLTSLTLVHDRFHHELLEILRSTPRIVNCTVMIMSTPSNAEIMSNTLDVPPLLHLRSLALTEEESPYAVPSFQPQILEKLTLPVLAKLHVCEMTFSSNTVASIRSLLARSGCPVNSLHIRIDKAEQSADYYRDRLPSVGNIRVIDQWGDEPDSEDELGRSEAWDSDASFCSLFV